jgi:hypothetical protein
VPHDPRSPQTAVQASFKDIGDIPDEEWELTFKVNIHAMF